MVGYSNADIEAIVLLAADYASERAGDVAIANQEGVFLDLVPVVLDAGSQFLAAAVRASRRSRMASSAETCRRVLIATCRPSARSAPL